MTKTEYIKTLEEIGIFTEVTPEQNLLAMRDELHRLLQIDNPTSSEQEDIERLKSSISEVSISEKEDAEIVMCHRAAKSFPVSVALHGQEPFDLKYRPDTSYGQKFAKVLDFLEIVKEGCDIFKTLLVIVNAPNRSYIFTYKKWVDGRFTSQVLGEERAYLALNRHDTDWSPEHKDGWEITERRNGHRINDNGDVVLDSTYDG